MRGPRKGVNLPFRDNTSNNGMVVIGLLFELKTVDIRGQESRFRGGAQVYKLFRKKEIFRRTPLWQYEQNGMLVVGLPLELKTVYIWWREQRFEGGAQSL